MSEYLDPSQEIEKHGVKLPHWQQSESMQFVTFRLGDAMPETKLRQWQEERAIWLSHYPKPWSEEHEKEYRRRFTSKTYHVTVTEAVLPNIFTWASAASGNRSIPANWTNDLATVSSPLGGDRASYTLNFTAAGTYTPANNKNAGFELNPLNFGSTVTLAGNSLAFVANGLALPAVNQNSGSTVTNHHRTAKPAV